MSKSKEPLDTRIERQIITGMIVSTSFLRKTAEVYRKHPKPPLTLFFTKIIAEWCIDYFDKHDSAPGKHIQDIFYANINQIPSEAKIELTKTFLSDLSEEYEKEEKFNESYRLTQTDKYFRLNHLKQQNKELSAAIEQENVEYAESIISDYNRITRPEVTGINPLTDEEFIKEIFSEDNPDRLFTFPGDLGKSLKSINRGNLFCILGKEGYGKSWFLQECAIQALNSELNVVFISTEMTEKEMGARIHMNLNALPVNLGDYNNICQDVILPQFDCEKNQNNKCGKRNRACKIGLLDLDNQRPEWYIKEIRKRERVKFNPNIPKDYIPCTNCRGSVDFDPVSFLRVESRKYLTGSKAVKKGKTLTRSKFRGKELKLIQFPSRTLTMQELRIYLKNWEDYEGFIPDVIITDYADKFLSRNQSFSYRNQINDIWEDHKSIAQELHCGMITASQTNATRRGKDIGDSDFAEDIRKKAHINKGIALNQTDWEKINGIMRVKILKERSARFSSQKEIMVLQSLDIGMPLIDSCKIIKKNKE